ncbi:MAG TPA: hypothetical protein VII45_09090 [Solirubrobacterales bacterium]
MTVREKDYLAVEPAPESESALLHTCQDGHRWTEHPDETVSPSWGYGGTHATWEGYDGKTCPEPERRWSIYVDGEGNPVGPCHGYRCPTCETINYVGACSRQDGTFAGQMRGDVCEYPHPACLKPIVSTARWMRVKVMLPVEGKGKAAGTYTYKPGWTADWVPLDESGAPAAIHVREPTLF